MQHFSITKRTTTSWIDDIGLVGDATGCVIASLQKLSGQMHPSVFNLIPAYEEALSGHTTCPLRRDGKRELVPNSPIHCNHKPPSL